MLQHDAAILPRIVAIGDIDEDEIAFAEAATGAVAADALALPPALGGLERRLLLARLITEWAKSPQVRADGGVPLVAQTPAAACALADDLARLIDDMTMRDVPWDKLDKLVPDALDPYWQLTLKFLQIAREAWPAILSERDHIEPAARRDALIKAETARLARKTDAPVIVAGSTGSIPATAELIATIARLPHGAVVLPGLDTDLDEATWRLISGEPPRSASLRVMQVGMRRPPPAIRNLRCKHCSRVSASPATPSRRWRSRAGASASSAKRCAPLRRPICGGSAPPIRGSKRMPTRRSTPSP